MSLLTSLTRPANAQQMPYLQSDLPFGGTSSTLSANAVFVRRIRVAKPVKVSQVSVFVVTASGNLDIAVYSSDGSTLTKLASTGSTAVSGTNALQDIAFAFTFLPGVDYYLAIAVDNGTASLWRVSVSGTNTANILSRGEQALFKASSFPTPSSITISGMSATGSSTWMLFA